MNFKMECPDRSLLLGWIEGTIDEWQANQIAEHCDTCNRCNERLVQLEQQSGQSDSLSHGSTFASDSVPTLIECPRIPGYQILDELGRGGMGVVYRARQDKLDRIVAVKFRRCGDAMDEQQEVRFGVEMKALGRLDHPNIVRAFDANSVDGVEYLVMEFVDGESVSALTRDRQFSVSNACEIVRQTALGLAYAHENDLVHRDVKPANLMVTKNGNVKILDLGLARMESEIPGTNVTHSGQVMGTVDYMSPEQASDASKVDWRTDIYSLGATLYQLLTGVAPLDGSNSRSLLEKLSALANHNIPPITSRRNSLPQQLEVIVNRMMAADVSERYQSASEVATDLLKYCDGHDLNCIWKETSQETVETRHLGHTDTLLEPHSDKASNDTTTDPVKTQRSKEGLPLRRIMGLFVPSMILIAAIVLYLSGAFSVPTSRTDESNQTLPSADPNAALPFVSGNRIPFHFQHQGTWDATNEHITDFYPLPDGQSVAVVRAYREFGICDAVTGSVSRTLVNNSPYIRCAVSHDGKRIATCERARIRVWDVQSFKTKLQYAGQQDTEFNDVIFSADDSRIIASTSRGLLIFDASNLSQISMIERNGWTGDLSVCGRKIFATSSTSLWYVDTRSGQDHVYEWDMGTPQQVQIGPSKKRAVLTYRNQAGEEDTLLIFPTSNPEKRRELDSGAGLIHCCSFLGNEDCFVTGDSLGQIRVFDADDGKPFANYKLPGGPTITRIVYDSNHRRMFVVLEHFQVMLYDVRN